MARPNAAPDNYYVAQKYWKNKAVFQVYDYDSTTPTIGTYIAADGKITYKESQLGEKKYYSHCITIDYPNTAHISFNYYSTNGDGLTNDTL